MVVQRTEEGSDPDAPWTAILGLTGVILTAVIVLGLESLFYHVNANEHRRKVVEVASEELLRERAKQLQNVTTYRYVDAVKGTVAIPIDRAMELVRDELRGTSRPPQAEPTQRMAPTHGAPVGASTEHGGAHSGH